MCIYYEIGYCSLDWLSCIDKHPDCLGYEFDNTGKPIKIENKKEIDY